MVGVQASSPPTAQQMTPRLPPINFVFLSCHFPPRYRLFAQRLKQRGVNVLGIGDEAYDNLHFELKDNLREYYKVSNMDDYDQLYRAVAHFIHKYGRINFIESFNEYWLVPEARLREDFNVVDGYRTKEMEQYKKKSAMKVIYQNAGLEVAKGFLPKTLDQAIEFAKEAKYPLVMKPDIGVGAEGARKINNEADLVREWDPKGNLYLEQFVQGHIETYDGLCDHTGRITFYSGLRYCNGVMDTVSGAGKSLYYYIVKDIPEDLRLVGDVVVKCFNVKSRFFHCEFFRTLDNKLLPLEINIRPPGGITVDMWNFAHRMDLYAEYASVITKQPTSNFQKAKYHCAYSAHRVSWKYVHTHDEIVKKLGTKLDFYCEMPPIFSPAMGNFAYLISADSFEEMKELIDYVELLSC